MAIFLLNAPVFLSTPTRSFSFTLQRNIDGRLRRPGGSCDPNISEHAETVLPPKKSVSKDRNPAVASCRATGLGGIPCSKECLRQIGGLREVTAKKQTGAVQSRICHCAHHIRPLGYLTARLGTNNTAPRKGMPCEQVTIQLVTSTDAQAPTRKQHRGAAAFARPARRARADAPRRGRHGARARLRETASPAGRFRNTPSTTSFGLLAWLARAVAWRAGRK